MKAALKDFPNLLAAAEQAGLAPQKSLAALAGSGKGLWGKNSARTLRRLPDEWNR